MKFVIDLNPVPKKNSLEIHVNPRTGKRFVSQGKIYKDYERACWPFIPHVDFPINVRCNIQAVFYRKDHRRVDLANLQEALLDILVTHGLIEDDNFNIVAGMDGSRVYVDKEHPRTEVTITWLKEE